MRTRNAGPRSLCGFLQFERAYLVVGVENGAILFLNHVVQIGWQIFRESFLISLLGSILAAFRFRDDGCIVVVSCHRLEVQQPAMEKCADSSAIAGRTAELADLTFELGSETRALRGEIEEQRFQICTGELFGRFAETDFTVLTNFFQVVQYRANIISA